jgi:hypothetical protein
MVKMDKITNLVLGLVIDLLYLTVYSLGRTSTVKAIASQAHAHAFGDEYSTGHSSKFRA